MQHIKTMHRIVIPILIIAGVLLFAAPIVYAANRTWDGEGDDDNWATTTNWSLDSAPVNGDTVTFDNTGTAAEDFVITTNNLTNLSLTGITFQGSGSGSHTIAGNSISLSGIVRDSNTGGAMNSITSTINATGTLWFYANESSTISLSGIINLGANTMALRSNLSGSIIYTGSVNGSGKVVIGGNGYGIVMLPGSQILQPITVKESGTLRGIGTVGPLYVSSANGKIIPSQCITTRNLTLRGWYQARIEGLTACSGYTRLNVLGKLDVTGAMLSTKNLFRGYVPDVGSSYRIINNDGTDKVVGNFKFRPEGSLFRLDRYVFRITYKGGTGNDVVLTRIQ